MPVSFRRQPAREQTDRRAYLFFPALCRAGLQRGKAWSIARRPLSLCGIGAILLLESASITHAQQDAAQRVGAVATAYRIPGFVETASHRSAVPASWIRAVMQAESGGVVHSVSPKGAMGLMQIMPDTWADLRSRYRLGSDPYDPHDNIIAGTAYLRELLDRYGERGFLAAYNAGPGRYEEHLETGRPLPSETLSYISAITSLRDSASSDGANSAASWTSSSLFIAATNADFAPLQPPPGQPQDRRPTNGTVPTARPHVPHSDGLFARKSDRREPP